MQSHARRVLQEGLFQKVMREVMRDAASRTESHARGHAQSHARSNFDEKSHARRRGHLQKVMRAYPVYAKVMREVMREVMRDSSSVPKVMRGGSLEICTGTGQQSCCRGAGQCARPTASSSSCPGSPPSSLCGICRLCAVGPRHPYTSQMLRMATSKRLEARWQKAEPYL
jgi:hypothetical protein